MSLYNQSPAAENASLRLKPVWEAEGATAYAGTPAFIVAGATSVGQICMSHPPFCLLAFGSHKTPSSHPARSPRWTQPDHRHRVAA